MLINFNNFLAKAKGRVQDPSFIYIRSTVNKNHSKVKNYVLNSSLHVSPNHLLVQLLQNLSINTNRSDSEIAIQVGDRMTQVASAFNITSNARFGKPFNNVFLDGGTEFILATKDSFDLRANWYDLEPIKFIYHSQTNVNCMIGTPKNDREHAFISINFPMLAVQYANWRRWIHTAGESQSVYNFIVKYPLFNALKSYMEISQFNRHYYRIIGKDIPVDSRFPTIATANIDSALDKSNLNIINMLTNSPTTIAGALYGVPCFFNDSMLDAINIPTDAITRQCRWITTVTQIPYICFGLKVSMETGTTLDQKILSELERRINAFRTERAIDNLQPVYSKMLTAEYVDTLYDLLEEIK